MRLTHVLYKQRVHYLFDKLWKDRRTLRRVDDFGVPKPILQEGFKVFDALEVTKTEEKLEPFELPEPYCEPVTAAKDSRNPDWHDKEAYLIHKSTRLLEGDKHMCLLTKTLRCEGTPKPLQGYESSQHETAAFEALWRVHFGDCYQIKLPRKLDVTKPHWRFPREFGVPIQRRVSLVLDNFNELCEKLTSHEPGAMEHALFKDLYSRVSLQKDDGNLMVFTSEVDSVLTSQKPLAAHSSPQEVAATAEVPLPDLFPAKYTLDLDTRNIYRMDDFFPLGGNKPRHIHTLHVTHPYYYFWFPEQKLARAILACFTFAAAQARHIYGVDTLTPPEPVVVQCTYSDVNSMGFLVYQLNTLNLANDEGVKNQVWVEEAQPLYSTCSREEGLQGHNGLLFDRFLAFYRS
uniref:Large ribosomal subunit protein mL37 n=1 Tax=Ornithodoros turicata TaxID=34597 RepID=A0A2R5LKJ6_9ACAR